LMVAYGWPLNGPVEIARAVNLEVGISYYESLVTRIFVAGAALVPVGLLCWAVAPAGHLGLTLCMAIANALFGLTPNWAAIGLGDARSIIVYDVIPRLALTMLSVPLLIYGMPVLVYPAVMIIGSATNVLLFSSRKIKPIRSRDSVFRVLQRRLTSQLPAASTTVAAGIYANGSLLIVGVAATVEQTALMASADRLYKVGLFSVMALTNAFQAYVVHEDVAESRRRRRTALWWHLMLAVVGLAGLATVGPVASRLMFGAEFTPNRWVFAWFGAAFAMLCLSSYLSRLVILPLAGASGLLLSTLVGAAVGVPLLAIFSAQRGAVGAALGLAIGELTVVVVQIALAIRTSSSVRHSGSTRASG